MNSRSFAIGLPAFILLAVLNSGGYRYGASDQAFYLPTVLARLDPGLYPRDGVVLAAQAHLTTYDEVIALIVRGTGASVPSVFAALHVIALTLIALGAWLVGRRIYRTEWATIALLAAMTLRHAIARSGTNTLEGYFHPRQLAFGLGLIAVGLFLRGRPAVVALLLAAAAALHPTAALWFTVWLATSAAILDARIRRFLAVAAAACAAAGVWALTAGPLAGRLAVIDDQWLLSLASKDYLFMQRWPPYAWTFNLGYFLIVGLVYARRNRAGLVDDRERALVMGTVSLAAAFVLFLALQSMGIILAFQLQPARLFLMFDFLAAVYAVWILAEGRAAHPRRAFATALAVVAFSIARGAYVVAHAERPLVQATIPADDWGRTMAWARASERGSGWLADPMHAVVYGTSIRVAGERDVYVEAVKDAALGIYDREIALRTQSRIAELRDFSELPAERAREIGSRNGLDYLVTESRLNLPLAFESGPLRVYRLR